MKTMCLKVDDGFPWLLGEENEEEEEEEEEEERPFNQLDWLKMVANSCTFSLTPEETPGLTHVERLSRESAQTVTDLLRENNEKYHIFITTEDHMGVRDAFARQVLRLALTSHQVYLHNHIAHHDLTLWALGAPPDVLRSQHQRNTVYMRGAMTICQPIVQDLADDDIFMKCAGREENFRNFERYFIGAITEKGYAWVLQKYLAGDGKLAQDMRYRIYMGYVHGFIHIGLALEFRQPLLLAEGLAQAAVHHDMWYAEYLSAAAEEAVKAEEAPLPLSTIVDLVQADPVIKNSSSLYFHTQTRKHSGRWAMDQEFARDGVLKNAKQNMVRLVARYRVDPDDLERATAELQNTAVYLTAGAQNPPHECAFDFYLLHCVTASIGHSPLFQDPSMTRAQKARLVESSGRVFMMTYAGMGAPEPRWDWIMSHSSKLPNQDWASVFNRVCYHEDDGHMSKMIRCTKHSQNTSAPFDHLPEFRVKQHMFLPAGIAMIDSGSKRPMTWTRHWDFVRGAGWNEAWSRFPSRNNAEGGSLGASNDVPAETGITQPHKFETTVAA
ncbi:MAG: hypothetical protein Q9159_007052 [Coniocarpon cinnabarinum]